LDRAGRLAPEPHPVELRRPKVKTTQRLTALAMAAFGAAVALILAALCLSS
jgi:hypothetical protein